MNQWLNKQSLRLPQKQSPRTQEFCSSTFISYQRWPCGRLSGESGVQDERIEEDWGDLHCIFPAPSLPLFLFCFLVKFAQVCKGWLLWSREPGGRQDGGISRDITGAWGQLWSAGSPGQLAPVVDVFLRFIERQLPHVWRIFLYLFQIWEAIKHHHILGNMVSPFLK